MPYLIDGGIKLNLTRPAWLEINLDYLIENINKIRNNVREDAEIISVVKSNAYGFGALKIVEILRENGVNFFAVATMSEAIAIRKKFKDVKLLILGYTPDYLMNVAVENDITSAIYNYESARTLNEIAKSQNKTATIHIVLDTGMNRIGFKNIDDSIEDIKKISKFKNIYIEGVFSHFAAADTNAEYTKRQFNIFKNATDILEKNKINIPIKHINNSSAILNYNEYSLDAVRPGIIQYGSTEGIKTKYKELNNVKYIGQIKAQVSNIKIVSKGEKVSYGLTYETSTETKIATIPLGYSDGILRQLSGKIDVLVSGKRCRQIGRICMDQMMVDVSGVDCNIGDEVVILGSQGNEYIDILEIARKVDEIATSYSCHFSPRLPKVYIKNGKIDEIVDELIK